MTGWLAIPRDWIASFGDIVKFCARVVDPIRRRYPNTRAQAVELRV